MTEQLKPCPFCGGEAKVITYEHTVYVVCNKCFCRTQAYINLNGKDIKKCIDYAVKDWNRRVGNDKE